MQNFEDISTIPNDLNPHLINNQVIELKDINSNDSNNNINNNIKNNINIKDINNIINNDNANKENEMETLPMLINQITPSQIHSIPNTVINEWGTYPHKVECPFCHKEVNTSVEASCNMGSCCLCFWLSCVTWAIILLFMGKEIGCADATHRCPNCKNVIGIYRSC